MVPNLVDSSVFFKCFWWNAEVNVRPNTSVKIKLETKLENYKILGMWDNSTIYEKNIKDIKIC